MKPFETLLAGALRLPLVGAALERAIETMHRATVRAFRRARRVQVRPRDWSNEELRKVASLYAGRVINVSGWRDEDKAGGHYRDYFSKASGYDISNYSGDRGTADGGGTIFLDLEGTVPEALVGAYQVVFNHTTLEHVYDIRGAIANLCMLSHDTVILVTPFLQGVHFLEGAFGDYWRPTPMCLTKMLAEHGLATIYQSCNDNPWYIVYVFTVAARDPEKYRGKMPDFAEPSVGTRHFVT